MTTTSSLSVVMEESLSFSARALANAKGPPREGLTQDFLAIALFGGPPYVEALFQTASQAKSASTFMPVKLNK